MNLKKSLIGIEFGSTRIKAVLLDEKHMPVSSGFFDWENSYENGIWTYSHEEIMMGLQECFKSLKKDFETGFGIQLTECGAIGISAMMHGYIALDANDNFLVPFRTWRNTITGAAAEKLTELLGFNIPQRWSIAHLYQAILNDEAHVPHISYLATLSAYIHYRLTGKKFIGIDDASGMFPIDSAVNDYNSVMAEKFKSLTGIALQEILPKVLVAGENAGFLTEEGAQLLDPSGEFKAGVPFAAPEGDAGTGMVATNSVALHTGNVSAGTSDFAMIVVDKELGVHREIDMVTTPAGRPVAMVHCNNCCSDIDDWAGLFAEFAKAIGAEIEPGKLFTLLYHKALEGEPDCGGLMNYNYLSGEGVTDLDEGRPVFARRPDAAFTLANFMRTHLYSAIATLAIGMDILTEKENVKIEKLYGHGGFFKTPGVGQRILSAAVGVPVAVMKTAGEGGPYGMALLAAYMLEKEADETLEDYLANKIFVNAEALEITASPEEREGFKKFLESYKACFDMEKAAIRGLK